MLPHWLRHANDRLLRESFGGNTLDFFYDSNGNAYALKYNGILYYYITNLQGDVMSIVDAQGAVVASYEYDPYGNLVSYEPAENTVGHLNPLRYRAYYYDSEAELYYLQSRYYDPAIGRFLNADSYASTGQGLLGNNMFAYCGNNPVNGYDPTGNAILPFPTLQDYYWMHKYVQYDIVEKYGYGMEVYVVGTKGIGRLDIYDGYTNSYYEVKHEPAASGMLFEQQLKKYDSSHVVGWRFEEYLIDGNVTKGQENISGTTQYRYWDIYYRKKEDGVIIYTWIINKKRYNMHIATVAIVAGAAIVGYMYSKTDSAPIGVDKKAWA